MADYHLWDQISACRDGALVPAEAGQTAALGDLGPAQEAERAAPGPPQVAPQAVRGPLLGAARAGLELPLVQDGQDRYPGPLLGALVGCPAPAPPFRAEAMGPAPLGSGRRPAWAGEGYLPADPVDGLANPPAPSWAP